MKNKKLLALVCASVLMLGAFTACSSKEDAPTTPVETPADNTEAPAEDGEEVTLQDGTYRAEVKEADERGWKAFVEATVVDGKITEANYDYVNADGGLKSEDEEYNKMMKDAAGTSPAEYGPALGEALVETQDPSKVDVVSGATHSSEIFTTLATALMENMTTGNTEVAIVE